MRPLTEPGARPSRRTPRPRPPCRFVRRFHHRAVGDLTLACEGLDMAAEPGLARTVHTTEPGSAPAAGLCPFAFWAAAREAVEPPPAAERAGWNPCLIRTGFGSGPGAP
ncbi:MmyB family transcriptional regulator [Streptomyces misionensis]|uniref:MmyB family transcriptional regulator n=1 Tax=Streptomyces misionensis TaxID=67331 RepID=UPI003682E4AC